MSTKFRQQKMVLIIAMKAVFDWLTLPLDMLTMTGNITTNCFSEIWLR